MSKRVWIVMGEPRMAVSLQVVSGAGGRVARGASEREMALRLYRSVMLVCVILIFWSVG